MNYRVPFFYRILQLRELLFINYNAYYNRMLRNFFLFIGAVLHLLFRGVLWHILRFRKGLKKSVAAIYEECNEPFNKKYFRRIYTYGGLGCLLNEWFIVLRGYAPSPSEAKAAFYLGTATAVYDDLFDHYDYTSEDSLDKLAKGLYKDNSVTEKCSKLFYDIILANIKNPVPFNEYLQRVGFHQEESKQQTNTQLSESELRRITYAKGACSIMLFRSVLSHELRPGEAAAFTLLGALIQLTDDVFDIRQDLIHHVATLPNLTSDIRIVRREYEQLLNQTLKAIQQLDYPPKYIRRFLMQIMMYISRGLVCFDQLERVQKKHGGPFQPSTYSRPELVCDMERPINLLRSIRYAICWEI